MKDLSNKGNYRTRALDDRSEFRKKKDGFLAGLSYAILVGAFLVAALFVWWSIEPSDVIEIDNRPVPVPALVDKSTGFVPVLIDFCKNLPLEANIERAFIGEDTRILQPEILENSPVGCYKRLVEVPIPPQAVPGVYTIKYSATYRINPIKEVTEQFETVPFRIVE